LRTRTRGEEGVASAHPVALVFVASLLWLRRRQWRFFVRTSSGEREVLSVWRRRRRTREEMEVEKSIM
jgi:hypothetical protein